MTNHIGSLLEIRRFHEALGGLDEPTALIAERHVAGDRQVTAFVAADSTAHADIVGAIERTRSIRGQYPVAAIRIITPSLPDDTTIELVGASGVLISTVRGYFAQTLDSVRLCAQTIQDADAQLPSNRYIDQRVQDTPLRATQYLQQAWLDNDDASLLVVLAPAGHGKTSLVMQFSRDLAQRHLESVDAPVPFLISLHRHRRVQNFEELILTHLEDLNVHGVTSGGFAYLANAGYVVPILDGFDELAETGGLRVARQTFREIYRRFESASKVLSSVIVTLWRDSVWKKKDLTNLTLLSWNHLIARRGGSFSSQTGRTRASYLYLMKLSTN